MKVPVQLRSETKPVILFKIQVDCSRVIDKFVWFYPLTLCRTAKSTVCFPKNKHKNSDLGVKKEFYNLRLCCVCKIAQLNEWTYFEVGYLEGWSYFRVWTQSDFFYVVSNMLQYGLLICSICVQKSPIMIYSNLVKNEN